MKRFAIAALALAFAAVSPALAANRPHGGGGGGHPAAHVSRAAMHTSHRPSMRMGGTHRSSAMRRSFRSSAHRTVHHRAVRHTTHHAVRHAARHAAHHAIRHAVHHEARHAVRHAEHRAVQRYAKVRRAIHARKRFHVGAYRRPRGWYAHHWVIGERLPRAWFVRDYWLSDWAIYGLWAPVDGLIWVRVGPDAMLVDPLSGEIIAVDYGLFFF